MQQKQVAWFDGVPMRKFRIDVEESPVDWRRILVTLVAADGHVKFSGHARIEVFAGRHLPQVVHNRIVPEGD